MYLEPYNPIKQYNEDIVVQYKTAQLQFWVRSWSQVGFVLMCLCVCVCLFVSGDWLMKAFN